MLCLEDMQPVLLLECVILLFVRLHAAQVTHCLSEEKIHTQQAIFKSQYSCHALCRVPAYNGSAYAVAIVRCILLTMGK